MRGFTEEVGGNDTGVIVAAAAVVSGRGTADDDQDGVALVVDDMMDLVFALLTSLSKLAYCSFVLG